MTQLTDGPPAEHSVSTVEPRKLPPGWWVGPSAIVLVAFFGFLVWALRANNSLGGVEQQQAVAEEFKALREERGVAFERFDVKLDGISEKITRIEVKQESMHGNQSELVSRLQRLEDTWRERGSQR